MFDTPVARFRTIGFIEGISFLLLLGIAMPLKYMAGMPKAVSVVGMAHGVLFIAYCIMIWLAAEDQGWSFKTMALAFIAAVVPFGPFVFDRMILSEAQEG